MAGIFWSSQLITAEEGVHRPGAASRCAELGQGRRSSRLSSLTWAAPDLRTDLSRILAQ